MKRHNNFLLLTSFVAGFSVMAIEISASRLLAPYFGTSIFIWTSIIGVVMVSLSLGYYFGGKLADKFPNIEFLLKLIFATGVFFFIIPLIIKPLSLIIDLNNIGLQTASSVIFVSSLIFSIILFSIPVFMLGVTSPFIFKLYLSGDVMAVGQSLGLVSAVSTAGSILGTFLPTLYLIPTFGTQNTFGICAALLIFLGSFGFRKKKSILLFCMLMAAMILIYGRSVTSSSAGTIFEDESVYQHIAVKQDLGGTRYLVVNAARGAESVYKSGKVLTGFFYDYFNVFPYLIDSDEPKKVLIIGLCGGTMANQLSHFFPGEVKIDGVEIDSKIIDVSKKYFNMDNVDVNIYNSDGRMFLQNNVKKYDLIIVDAYAQEFYVPWTLTTKEFWKLTNDSLGPHGIVAINVNSTTEDSPLLKAISNSMASVFSNNYSTHINNGDINYILAGSNFPMDLNRLDNPGVNDELLQVALLYKNATKKVFYDSKSTVLTDDKAPVELMTESMILNRIKKSK